MVFLCIGGLFQCFLNFLWEVSKIKSKAMLLFLVSFVSLVLVNLGYGLEITWNEPSSNNQYYWNNFTLNISTNYNANCSYQIKYLNGSNATNVINFSNNTVNHTVLIDVESLAHGYDFNITVHCWNSTNSSDDANSSRIIKRDYECNDSVHSNWILGHDLSCNTNYALIFSNPSITFDCNAHIISYLGNQEAIKINASNIVLRNCTIKVNESTTLNATNANNITIQDCLILGNNSKEGKGLVFKNITLASVIDNTFNNVTLPLVLESLRDSLVQGNDILNSTGSHVAWIKGSYNYRTTNLTFRDNVIILNKSSVSGIIYLTNTENSAFINNTILSTVTGDAFLLFSYNSTLFKNNYINVTSDVFNEGDASIIKSKNRFIGNTLITTNRRVFSYSSGSGYKNYLIKDNVIRNTAYSAIEFNGVPVTGFNIINNSISTYIYINGSSAQNMSIRDNTIVNKNQYGEGIVITEKAYNITIYHNLIKGGQYGYHLVINTTQNTMLNIYKNNLSGQTTQYKIYSAQPLFVDYNGMGNYWGYSGNKCPGFIPGVDSNSLNVIDRYPYNDAACKDYACDCGDVIDKSVVLYRNITCNNSQRLLEINNSNVTLNCNGRKLVNTNSSLLTTGVYVSGENNITIMNCKIENTNYSINIIGQNTVYNNFKLINNTITNAIEGIRLYHLGDFYLDNITLINNTILNSHIGIHVYKQNESRKITNVRMIENNITNAGLTGIILEAIDDINLSRNAVINTIYGINISNISNMNLTFNGFITQNYGLVDSGDNINIAVSNNFWGNNECPLFLYGRDTNSMNIYDIMPINMSRQTVTCSPIYKGVTIYKDSAFTTPIDRNSSNNWYYYYNGSNVYLEFEILPSNFILYEVNLTHGSTIIANLTPINSNRTRWRANFTLLVDHSQFRSNASYRWNITIKQPGYTGPAQAFFAIININPIDSQSMAYVSWLGGRTTNWTTITDFSNVTNLIFERPGFGLINFTDSINLLDQTTLNAFSELNNNMNISEGRINLEAASNALRELNKSAWLLFNLSQISGINISALNYSYLRNKTLMNNNVCPSTVCSNFSYNSSTGLYRFHVSHWTEYSVDLIPPQITLTLSNTGKTIHISVTTDEQAICKYALNNTNYENMSNFTNTNSTSHSVNHTVNDYGTYRVYVKCRDLVNNEGSKNRSITISAPSTGGTSGGTSSSWSSGELGELELNHEKVQIVRLGKTLSFTHKNQRHKIVINSIDYNNKKATITIYSTPKTITLSENEIKYVDTDDNGLNDLKIWIEVLSEAYIKLHLTAIEEEEEEEEKPSKEEEEEETKPTTTEEKEIKEKEQQPTEQQPKEEKKEEKKEEVIKETKEKKEEIKEKKIKYLWITLLAIILIVVLLIIGISGRKKVK